VWAVPTAVEFTFLPDPVDVGFIGSGSAVGGVAGGLFAYARGYLPEEIAGEAAITAVIAGAWAGVVWLLGLSGVESMA
jgi:hypothetical protein